MPRFRLVLFVCLCIALGASASGCSSGASSASALGAHEWKVVKLGGNAYSGPAQINAKFSADTITGSTGVNSYNGTYDAPKANAISITVGAVTRRAGPPAAMKAETDYLQALANAASYAVDEQSLTFFDASGVSTVQYAVLVPLPLVGTRWTMTAYNNGGGGFQSAESSAQVNAVFAADGTLSGNGGVNKYNSKYSISGSTIKIGPIAATQTAGPASISAQEAAYFAALPKAATYAIEGDQLILRDSTGSAMAGYQGTK